ncbi:LysR family transcriptional regulator substrate-binding protein [Lentibacillus sp. JNUCC-1]|uniref:LysR family transcriptional regulator substrate-binding protein n=1 Tax=Lentibacillus sp. JNUCC-1 TaxID=2654513 RepID=UPI002F90A96B
MEEEVKKENKKLKVGMTVLFAIQYMDQIVHYITMNPDVELAFAQGGSVKLQRMLATKEIDIGLLSFPNYEPSITIQKLKTSHHSYDVSVVMPYDHPLADKKSIKISDLEGYKICSLSDSYVLGRVIEERCHDYGFHPNIIFTNSNWEVILQNTLTTGGITFMPTPLKKLSNFGELVWIPLDDKANQFEIGVAKRKDEQLNSVAVKFIDHIKHN